MLLLETDPVVITTDASWRSDLGAFHATLIQRGAECHQAVGKMALHCTNGAEAEISAWLHALVAAIHLHPNAVMVQIKTDAKYAITRFICWRKQKRKCTASDTEIMLFEAIEDVVGARKLLFTFCTSKSGGDPGVRWCDRAAAKAMLSCRV